MTICKGGDEWNCSLPELVPMEQDIHDSTVIANPREKARDEIHSQIARLDRFKPGNRVAITVGSRGIGCISDIVAGVVDAVKKAGCTPFIVPAMGSHGGENPREKAQILAHLGITEDRVGAPVSLCSEIALAGTAKDRVPIYCQKEAYEADAIILLNRIKTHTDFSSEIESGLVKIACVGLGGYQGAQWVHAMGYDKLAERIRAAGEGAIRMLNIPVALAIIEGHSGKPVLLKALTRDEIVPGEKKLLGEVRAHLARLPLDSLDLLVVYEMGKDISGLGLDSFVTGRYPSGKNPSPSHGPSIYRIAVLNLTEASEGNASGIGMCDVTTQKLYDKIDFSLMYKNVITSRGSASAKIPYVMRSDREAIAVGLLTCFTPLADAKLMLIKNTLQLRTFFVSKPLVPLCKEAGAKIVGPSLEITFDCEGNLKTPSFH
jgi:hypothetical protein